MDELARYNRERWEELAQSNVAYSLPWFDLDRHSARQRVDSHGMMKDVTDRDVLCLASGGGQQSAAFGLLGANVTVLDLSQTQLQRDQLAAEHYGIQLRIQQGDMRHFPQLEGSSFDLVWQGYSINFVPDVTPVFEEVARVIRSCGLYYLMFANPFTHYSVDENAWNGESYPLKYPYIDGVETTSLGPDWEYWDVEIGNGEWLKVRGPKEFRHSLSTLTNALIRQGFMILGLWEKIRGDLEAEPGSWEHFKAFAPPYLELWAEYRPESFR